MRKFFGIKEAQRTEIPEAKRAVGVEGDEEFFAEYFNQAIYETQVDFVIGTTTQVTNGTANIKIGTGAVFQDALGATMIFAQGDRIAIIGHDALDADLVFTANDLVFMMNPGVTINQNSAYKTIISGLNCRGNLNFSNAFASSIVVGDTTSLLDIQTDLAGSVMALGDVVINGNLYNDDKHENLLYGCYEAAQRGTSFAGATTGYHLDGDYNVVAGAVTISQVSSGAPIGSGHYVEYLYGGASSKCDSAQALRSEIVEIVKGKTITGSVLVRCGGSFAADLTLRVQRNSTPNVMTPVINWTDIGSITIANANIPTGTGSADWALISVTVDIVDDAAYNGLRWFVEPSAVGGSGEFFCLAQPQLHVGTVARPYSVRPDNFLLCNDYLRTSYPYGTPVGTSGLDSATGGVVSIAPRAITDQYELKAQFDRPMRATPIVTWYGLSSGLPNKILRASPAAEFDVVDQSGQTNRSTGYPVLNTAVAVDDYLSAHHVSSAELT